MLLVCLTGVGVGFLRLYDIRHPVENIMQHDIDLHTIPWSRLQTYALKLHWSFRTFLKLRILSGTFAGAAVVA